MIIDDTSMLIAKICFNHVFNYNYFIKKMYQLFENLNIIAELREFDELDIRIPQIN